MVVVTISTSVRRQPLLVLPSPVRKLVLSPPAGYVISPLLFLPHHPHCSTLPDWSFAWFGQSQGCVDGFTLWCIHLSLCAFRSYHIYVSSHKMLYAPTELHMHHLMPLHAPSTSIVIFLLRGAERPPVNQITLYGCALQLTALSRRLIHFLPPPFLDIN